MKVVAFNGSPREAGNTALLIKYVLKELETEGIDCELINIFGRISSGCSACYKCVANMNRRCAIEEDDLNYFLEKMIEADGIIIGSPTYFASLTAETKALIDRTGFVAKRNGSMLRRKAGAAVVAVRRAGAKNIFIFPVMDTLVSLHYVIMEIINRSWINSMNQKHLSLVIRKIYSQTLGEYIFIVSDDLPAKRIKKLDGVVYTNKEISLLKGLTKDGLKTIHNAKKLFDAELVDPGKFRGFLN